MRDGPKNGCYRLAGTLPFLLPLVWRCIDQSGVGLEMHLGWEMQGDDGRWEGKGREKRKLCLNHVQHSLITVDCNTNHSLVN